MLKTNIQIPMVKIEEFCRKWQIKEFSLFGSILRKDFGPKSDVDEGGAMDIIGSVGACKEADCKYNNSLECSAPGIHG